MANIKIEIFEGCQKKENNGWPAKETEECRFMPAHAQWFPSDWRWQVIDNNDVIDITIANFPRRRQPSDFPMRETPATHSETFEEGSRKRSQFQFLRQLVASKESVAIRWTWTLMASCIRFGSWHLSDVGKSKLSERNTARLLAHVIYQSDADIFALQGLSAASVAESAGLLSKVITFLRRERRNDAGAQEEIESTWSTSWVQLLKNRRDHWTA